jgi:beta-hydroxyacyl-ACP dehydratase FabZ
MMSENQQVVFDTTKIQEFLPHRYPFLMVDRVIEFVNNEKMVAIKAVTFNEPFFQGHFPGKPVMPGVMILEALAQTAGIMAKASDLGIAGDKMIYLVGAKDFKWKRQVVPGDTLRLEINSVSRRGPLWMMSGEVTVDGKLVASGTLSAMESE